MTHSNSETISIILGKCCLGARRRMTERPEIKETNHLSYPSNPPSSTTLSVLPSLAVGPRNSASYRPTLQESRFLWSTDSYSVFSQSDTHRICAVLLPLVLNQDCWRLVRPVYKRVDPSEHEILEPCLRVLVQNHWGTKHPAACIRTDCVHPILVDYFVFGD
jgi:hypothetical protein